MLAPDLDQPGVESGELPYGPVTPLGLGEQANKDSGQPRWVGLGLEGEVGYGGESVEGAVYCRVGPELWHVWSAAAVPAF